MPEIIIFIVGVASAIRGADWIGKSAVSWGKRKGLSQIVIGATLVSVATTLPELGIAAISGAVNQEPRIGLGAVLGSPLINIGLILGAFFLFAKERPKLGYYSRTLNIFVLLSILLLVISLNSTLGGVLSILLIILGIAFVSLEFLLGKRHNDFLDEIYSRFEDFLSLFDFSKNKREALEFVVGVVLLAIGSKFITDSIYSLSVTMKVNELFISITIVALGTSLPELITAINSFFKKRSALSIGNLIGASVIDLTLGVGIATIFHSSALSTLETYQIFLPMIGIGLISLLAVWKKIPLNLVGVGLICFSILSLLVFSFNQLL